MGGTGWCQGALVFIEVGDWGRPQALFLACGMRRNGLLPVSLNTDFRVHRQTASYLNVVFLERDFQEKGGFSMGEKGGREAYQEEVASRLQGVSRSHSINKKSPRMPTACLGSGRMVSGSIRLINQVVYSVSAPFRIIKGKFRNHISYMGIANMIKNVTVMSTSPVSRVNT